MNTKEETVTTVVEWVPFILKPAFTEQQLREASQVMHDGFLKQQPGFMGRHLLNQGPNKYIDLVIWASQEAAQEAMKQIQDSEACGHYFKHLELDPEDPNGGVQHFNVLNSYQ